MLIRSIVLGVLAAITISVSPVMAQVAGTGGLGSGDDAFASEFAPGDQDGPQQCSTLGQECGGDNSGGSTMGIQWPCCDELRCVKESFSGGGASSGYRYVCRR